MLCAKICLLTFVVCLPILSMATGQDCTLALTSTRIEMDPKEQRLMIGLLVEGVRNDYILAMGDYYKSDHATLYNGIQKQSEIARVLWGGEMLFENPEATTHEGVLVFTLNTSGFVFQTLQQPGQPHVNDPLILKWILEARRPQWITPFTQFYSHSPEFAHLDQLMQKIHASEPRGASQNVRHQFLNIASPLSSFSLLASGTAPETEVEASLEQMSSTTLHDLLLLLETQMRYTSRGASPQALVELHLLRELEVEEWFKKENLSRIVKLLRSTVSLQPRSPWPLEIINLGVH